MVNFKKNEGKTYITYDSPDVYFSCETYKGAYPGATSLWHLSKRIKKGKRTGLFKVGRHKKKTTCVRHMKKEMKKWEDL